MKFKRTKVATTALSATVLAGAVLAGSSPCIAQAGCPAGSYRVIARRWDAVLKTNWELRQDCTHPEWPSRLAVAASGPLTANSDLPATQQSTQYVQPLLVRAGDPVRLWMQDDRVRIEMNGVAEQSARAGEHITIRIMHQTDEVGLTVERIAGIVRGAGDVEMER